MGGFFGNPDEEFLRFPSGDTGPVRSPGMIATLEGLEPDTNSLATRSSLLRAIADPGAVSRWEEFDRIYRRLVFGMARRAGLNHHDSEDLTQDVFRDLVRSLAHFETRSRPGSFRRFLCNLVRWRIATRLARKGPKVFEAVFPDDPDSEVGAIEAPMGPSERDEVDFRKAVTQALMVLSRELAPKHVQLLDLYFCKELPAKAVGEILGMPSATVFTIAHRHKLRLLREILRRL